MRFQVKSLVVPALTALLLAASSGQAHAGNIVSNLANPNDPTTVGVFFPFFAAAQGLTTGSTAVSLESITVPLAVGGQPPKPATFSLHAHDPSTQAPGALLASAPTQSVVASTASLYTFTFASPSELAPNATYWLVATTTAGGANMLWYPTEDPSFTSDFGVTLSGWRMGPDPTWRTGSSFVNHKIGIEGSVVPEPGAAAALLSGMISLLAGRRHRAML
jgi:hypothetical protein